MTDTADLKKKFWNALADSPFLFLQRNDDPHTAVPMTAQLDKHANHAIWFFTAKDHPLAKGGPATATFVGKDHNIFARFTGNLAHETDRDRLEKQWSASVESWFSEGKDDPKLLMLRMDLGRAEIWNSDFGFIDNAKKAMGFDVREEAREGHTDALL